MGSALEVPLWLVWTCLVVWTILSAFFGIAAGLVAFYRARGDEEPAYMQLRAKLDEQGRPTIEPIYQSDETAAVAEGLRARGGVGRHRIPGLDDGD